MRLKELKNSIARFGSDFDDCQVFMSFRDSTGAEEYDLIGGTGHDKSMEFIVLIGMGTIDKHLENPINKKFKKD